MSLGAWPWSIPLKRGTYIPPWRPRLARPTVGLRREACAGRRGAIDGIAAVAPALSTTSPPELSREALGACQDCRCASANLWSARIAVKPRRRPRPSSRSSAPSTGGVWCARRTKRARSCCVGVVLCAGHGSRKRPRTQPRGDAHRESFVRRLQQQPRLGQERDAPNHLDDDGRARGEKFMQQISRLRSSARHGSPT